MKRIALGAVLLASLVVGRAYLYLNQPQFRVDVPEQRAKQGLSERSERCKTYSNDGDLVKRFGFHNLG